MNNPYINEDNAAYCPIYENNTQPGPIDNAINNAVKEFRSNSKLNENWKKEIENDVKKRGK